MKDVPWYSANENRQRRHASRVYFIEAPQLSLIKIGVSLDVERRLDQLRSGCPVELVLLGSMFGTQYDEETLHNAFSDAWVRGEWFRAEVVRPFAVSVIGKPRRTVAARMRAVSKARTPWQGHLDVQVPHEASCDFESVSDEHVSTVATQENPVTSTDDHGPWTSVDTRCA